MSAQDHLSDLQFNHENWERYSKGSHYRGLQVTAHHPKFGVVGRMDLDPEQNESGGREILDVNVPAFQRRGIATGMYNHAREAGLNPEHSTWRTDEGDAWARKVGGPLPPRDERR